MDEPHHNSRFQVELTDQSSTLVFKGVLNQSNAQASYDELLNSLTLNSLVKACDLKLLKHCDSAALAVLCALKKSNPHLFFKNPPKHLFKLAQLMRVSFLFE